ncbi:hypothetical protein G7067_02030 [Leucobacter insecticola]|uniref:Uncharacterized protein n=1 Tax=Leucobacter insecticola TaxID=2714934 RepID=A0A6G8FHF1_9MICO|nr:hypothetical protein [Leucobacter insecticola]QIM15462.1 hypothetical protein G7067_02030 [Leucobacter insecticola]
MYIVTYRSFDPPGALPPEFARIESCSAHQRGDDVVVVRERRPDGSVKVWLIHPDTRAAALREAALWGGGAGVLMGGLIWGGSVGKPLVAVVAAAAGRVATGREVWFGPLAVDATECGAAMILRQSRLANTNNQGLGIARRLRIPARLRSVNGCLAQRPWSSNRMKHGCALRFAGRLPVSVFMVVVSAMYPDLLPK